MAKHVIETISIFRNLYYVEVDDPVWAEDSIVMKELDAFASEFKDEIIMSTQTMAEGEEWPVVHGNIVDGTTYAWSTYVDDKENGEFVAQVRWDLADKTVSL